MKRSKKMALFDRAEEIYDSLPKEYADVILNSIIAKSLSNGSFTKEASSFLRTEDLDNILKDLKAPYIRTKVGSSKKPMFKKEKKISELFQGFN